MYLPLATLDWVRSAKSFLATVGLAAIADADNLNIAAAHLAVEQPPGSTRSRNSGG